jgi:hypothetical protein
MIAIAALVVVLASAMIIPVFATTVTLVSAMLLLITRSVLTVVPVVLHKEDPLTAGVVFAAVLAPVSGMARRNAQIDGRAVNRYPLDCYGLTINQLRLWVAADVESAIEARLTDAERNANVGSERLDSDS